MASATLSLIAEPLVVNVAVVEPSADSPTNAVALVVKVALVVNVPNLTYASCQLALSSENGQASKLNQLSNWSKLGFL